MSDLRERLQGEFEKLKTKRDELRVQLDLGKKEAADAWDDLDHHWGEVEQKMKQLARASKDAAEDIGDAAGDVVDDARTGLRLTVDEAGKSAEKLLNEVKERFKSLRELL